MFNGKDDMNEALARLKQNILTVEKCRAAFSMAEYSQDMECFHQRSSLDIYSQNITTSC
jgi:hypothetical protein